MGAVLVLNSGSSSIKFALFDQGLQQVLSGSATEIGGPSVLTLTSATAEQIEDRTALPTHAAALDAILQQLAKRGIDIATLSGAGHRVVHGGAHLQSSCIVTDVVADQIRRCEALAPLHNPHNLAAILALKTLAPDLPQVACFDTAFHSSNPAVAVRYALPDTPEMRPLRRYGFHGISYQGLVASLRDAPGSRLPPRLLALHLGNGASLCAIKDGRSVATTMGYSPLEGLTMGTRCGTLDANLALHLAATHGIAETTALLNKRSGLLGLGGHSDMRALHADGSAAARFAVQHFCYWAVRHSGSMIAAMGGLDGIAFTGGVGENDAQVRQAILDGLSWLGVAADLQRNAQNASRIDLPDSGISVWIVEAGEEKTIAADALRLLETAK